MHLHFTPVLTVVTVGNAAQKHKSHPVGKTKQNKVPDLKGQAQGAEKRPLVASLLERHIL